MEECGTKKREDKFSWSRLGITSTGFQQQKKEGRHTNLLLDMSEHKDFSVILVYCCWVCGLTCNCVWSKQLATNGNEEKSRRQMQWGKLNQRKSPIMGQVFHLFLMQYKRPNFSAFKRGFMKKSYTNYCFWIFPPICFSRKTTCICIGFVRVHNWAHLANRNTWMIIAQRCFHTEQWGFYKACTIN